MLDQGAVAGKMPSPAFPLRTKLLNAITAMDKSPILGLGLCGAGARAHVVFGGLLQQTNRVRLQSVYDPAPDISTRLQGCSGLQTAAAMGAHSPKCWKIHPCIGWP